MAMHNCAGGNRNIFGLRRASDALSQGRLNRSGKGHARLMAPCLIDNMGWNKRAEGVAPYKKDRDLNISGGLSSIDGEVIDLPVVLA